MARLPDETAFGALGEMHSRRPIATYDPSGYARGAAALAKGTEDIGKGLAGAGGDLALVARGQALEQRRQQEADDRLEVARAKGEFLTKKIEFDSTLENDSDHATLPERYRAKIEEIRTGAAGQIKNLRTRELFELSMADDAARGIANADKTANRKWNDATLTETNALLETYRQSLLKSTDEVERARLLDTTRDLINSLADKNIISRNEAGKKAREFSENYAVAAIEIKPPAERINLLREAPQGREAVLDRIRGSENASGDPAARNPKSSAMGDFQFIEGTWLTTIKAHRPELAHGRSDADLLALRADPRLSREMAGHLLDANAAVLQANGLSASAGNLYLAHFLGADGAVKVVKADAGTPVIDIVGAKAVDANRSVLAGKTTGSVIAWAEGKMGGTARRTGSLIDFVPEDKRVAMLQRAEGEALRQQAQADSEAKLDEYTVKQRIKDDVASTLDGGIGIDLDAGRVRRSLGSKGVQEWQDARADAHAIWVASHDLYALSEAEIAQRLIRVRPKAGEPDFDRRMAVYEQVEKRVSTLRDQRQDDPAASINDDPAVRSAAAAVNLADAATLAALHSARLAAQERAGIPEAVRSPITRAEASALATPLRDMLPGQERAALRQVAEVARERYGEHADHALAAAFRTLRMDADTARKAARVLQSLALNRIPVRDDLRALDEAQELEAARKAMRRPEADSMIDYQIATQRAAEQGLPVPPPESAVKVAPAAALKALLADPELAEEFDAKYGKGAAKQVLEQPRKR